MLGLTNEEHKDIAYIIIDNYFLKNYLPTVNPNKKWYDNLSDFVLIEWDKVANKNVESKFDEDDEEEINMQAFHILMDSLDIDEDENGNLITETEAEKITRLGARPTSYTSS